MLARFPLRLVAVSVAALAFSSMAEDTGFMPIFNGRDLAGWEGDARLWSVKDGAIRGQTTLSNMTLRNTFLIWKAAQLRDFELKITFRIQNGNSGVQYRSKDLGKYVVSGYQAEIENTPGKVGFLYEEKGRKHLVNVGEKVRISPDGERKLTGQIAAEAEYIQKRYYKSKEWNEYRIVARGNHIAHYLNGFQTVDLIDEDSKARREGILALQIHAGPPMLVEFRDVLLKKL